MNQDRQEFTLIHAFVIQEGQLAEWQSILQPDKFALLLAHAQRVNEVTTDPYKVFRGVDMDNWIANNLKDRKAQRVIVFNLEYKPAVKKRNDHTLTIKGETIVSSTASELVDFAALRMTRKRDWQEIKEAIRLGTPLQMNID